MITADEVVAAGSGKYYTANSNYYLYKGNWYRTLSPCNFPGNYAAVLRVNSTGNLYYSNVHSEGGVAPVISLSAEYVRTMSGNGTTTSPYEVK